MRDRLVTLLGGAAALAVVYTLFARGPSTPPVSRPQSTEAKQNGYLALRTWLEHEGVHVVSLQQRFDRLAAADFDAPPIGNVLISTLPHLTRPRSDELAALYKWIDAGNTLLVLAALDDTPEWATGTDVSFRADLRALTAMDFTAARDERGGFGAPIRPGSTLDLERASQHPLMAGVESLEGFSDDSSSLWRPVPTQYTLLLKLARERSSGLDALWQRPWGSGQVIVAASATLLENRNVGRGDTRRFVANLLAYHLGSGGAVIFDDMHQGLTTLYDVAALLADPRLRATLAFLVAAWAIYLLGSSNRLAPPVAARAAPRQGEFLAAAGGFMARRLGPIEAGLLLLEQWFDEVRAHHGAARGTGPPWAELEAMPALAPGVLAELRDSHAALAAGRAVDLVRLHNIVKKAREAIG